MLPHHRPISLICPVDDLQNLLILFKACQQATTTQRPWRIWVSQASAPSNLDSQSLRRLLPPSGRADTGWQLQPAVAASDCKLAESDETVIVCVESEARWLRQQWSANQWLTLGNGGYRAGQIQQPGEHSALLQYAELTGETLSPAELTIAINDQEYLPGLSRIGLPFDQALSLRQAELWIKGYDLHTQALSLSDEYTQQVLTFASDIQGLLPQQPSTSFRQSDWISSPANSSESNESPWNPHLKEQGLGLVREFGDITFILAPASFKPIFLDSLQLPFHQQEYVKSARHSRPLPLKNWLIFYINGNDESLPTTPVSPSSVNAIEFSGSAHQCEFIRSLCKNPHYARHFHLSTSPNPDSDYLRIECISTGATLNQAAMTDIISELLTVIMKTSRPLRNYSLDLLFPLQSGTEHSVDAPLPAVNTGPVLPAKHPYYSAATSQPWSIRKVVLTNDVIADHTADSHRASKPADVDQNCLKTRYEEYFAVYEYMDSSLRRHLLEAIDSSAKPRNPADDLHEKPIREYLLTQTDSLADEDDHGILALFKKDGKTHRALARITKVRIYEYYNKERILSISLAPVWDEESAESLHQKRRRESDKFVRSASFSIESDDSDWWISLVFSEPPELQRLKHLQIDNWLAFTEVARNLYNPIRYTENEVLKENHAAWISTADFRQKKYADNSFVWQHDWVKRILLPFFCNDTSTTVQHAIDYLETAIQQYPDNRMFVNVAYTLAGPAPGCSYSRETDQQVFSLAAFVDHKGSLIDPYPYAYNADFVSDLLDECSFKRWKEITFSAAFTDYANVYLAYGGFAADKLTLHIRYIYLRLLLVALFYRSTIRKFSRTISHKGQLLKEADKHSMALGRDAYKEFRHIRADFIDFTNLYWFKTISHMVQGKEIFALQTKGLEIDNEYEFVKEEMSWADSYIESRQAQQAEKNATYLNIIIGAFSVIALALQFIALEEGDYATSKMVASGAIVLFSMAALILWSARDSGNESRIKMSGLLYSIRKLRLKMPAAFRRVKILMAIILGCAGLLLSLQAWQLDIIRQATEAPPQQINTTVNNKVVESVSSDISDHNGNPNRPDSEDNQYAISDNSEASAPGVSEQKHIEKAEALNGPDDVEQPSASEPADSSSSNPGND